MPKSSLRSSTARKPHANISNGEKPYACSRSKMQADRGVKSALDRLLLARSELSVLLNEIDETLDQSSDHHLRIAAAHMDIESLINVLSDMYSSIKPWVLRLKQAFTTSKNADCNPNSGNSSPRRGNEPEVNMMISPSPLVAWRAGGCRSVSERKLFLLTPLSKAKPGKIKMKDADSNSTLQLCPLVTTTMFRSDITESVEVIDRQNVDKASVNPSTSFRPLLKSSKLDFGHRTESSNHFTGNEVSEVFSLIYQLPNSPKSSYHFTSRSRETNEEVLEWFLSPPKTCTLMDPNHGSNKKSSGRSKLKISVCLNPIDESSRQAGIFNEQAQQLCGLDLSKNFTSKRELDEALEWFLSPPKTCILMEPSDVKISFSSSILDGTALKSKHPGENTLKKELWTKFEAVSKSSKAFVFQKTARKAFMDMLEEASSEMTDSL